MKYSFWIAGLFGLLILSCSSVQTQYDYDRDTDFSKYKTFSFYQKGLDSLDMNDLDKSRVTNAIISNLEQKGLQLSPNGELVINISASYREKTNVYNNNPYGGWGGYGRYGYGGNTTVNQYLEGRLLVDLVDKERNMLVWQGLAKGFDVDQIRRKDEMIPKTIDKLFYNYPPKK